jgi:hypothetical protein
VQFEDGSTHGRWGKSAAEEGLKNFQKRWAERANQSYPSIPITPAMREKILKEGLPLFNVAALSALVSRILGQGQPDTEGEDGGGF